MKKLRKSLGLGVTLLGLSQDVLTGNSVDTRTYSKDYVSTFNAVVREASTDFQIGDINASYGIVTMSKGIGAFDWGGVATIKVTRVSETESSVHIKWNSNFGGVGLKSRVAKKFWSGLGDLLK